MTALPNYRAHVLAYLPALTSLDGKAVSVSERSRAEGALAQEAACMGVMLGNACLVHKLVSTVDRPVERPVQQATALAVGLCLNSTWSLQHILQPSHGLHVLGVWLKCPAGICTVLMRSIEHLLFTALGMGCNPTMPTTRGPPAVK